MPPAAPRPARRMCRLQLALLATLLLLSSSHSQLILLEAAPAASLHGEPHEHLGGQLLVSGPDALNQPRQEEQRPAADHIDYSHLSHNDLELDYSGMLDGTEDLSEPYYAQYGVELDRTAPYYDDPYYSQLDDREFNQLISEMVAASGNAIAGDLLSSGPGQEDQPPALPEAAQRSGSGLYERPDYHGAEGVYRQHGTGGAAAGPDSEEQPPAAIAPSSGSEVDQRPDYYASELYEDPDYYAAQRDFEKYGDMVAAARYEDGEQLPGPLAGGSDSNPGEQPDYYAAELEDKEYWELWAAAAFDNGEQIPGQLAGSSEGGLGQKHDYYSTGVEDKEYRERVSAAGLDLDEQLLAARLDQGSEGGLDEQPDYYGDELDYKEYRERAAAGFDLAQSGEGRLYEDADYFYTSELDYKEYREMVAAAGFENRDPAYLDGSSGDVPGELAGQPGGGSGRDGSSSGLAQGALAQHMLRGAASGWLDVLELEVELELEVLQEQEQEQQQGPAEVEVLLQEEQAYQHYQRMSAATSAALFARAIRTRTLEHLLQYLQYLALPTTPTQDLDLDPDQEYQETHFDEDDFMASLAPSPSSSATSSVSSGYSGRVISPPPSPYLLLDLDGDGYPDLELALVGSDGQVNWRLLLLGVLLLGTLVMAVGFVRSLVQLRAAMGACGGAGRVLVPVMFERDGEMVQWLMLLDDGEEGGMGTGKGAWGMQGKGGWTMQAEGKGAFLAGDWKV